MAGWSRRQEAQGRGGGSLIDLVSYFSLARPVFAVGLVRSGPVGATRPQFCIRLISLWTARASAPGQGEGAQLFEMVSKRQSIDKAVLANLGDDVGGCHPFLGNRPYGL